MTPDQLQQVADLVAAKLSAPPGWAYAAMIVCAALGAGIGAYIKKRFENYATTADFEELTRQLVANTEATEGVKAALASRSWVKQQLWAQREKHYMELMRQLSTVMRSAQALFVIAEQDLRTGRASSPEVRHRVAQLEAEMREAENELRHALAPAAVFLSSATHKEVAQLVGKREVITNNAIAAFDFYEEWVAEVRVAYEEVLYEARREIREAFEEEPPSTP